MSQEDGVKIYEVDISGPESEDLVVAVACLNPGCAHGVLGLLYKDDPVSNPDLMAKTLDHRVLHGVKNVAAGKSEALAMLKSELIEHLDKEKHSMGIVFITDHIPALGRRGGDDPLRNEIEKVVGLN
jgi:hypothetical protein